MPHLRHQPALVLLYRKVSRLHLLLLRMQCTRTRRFHLLLSRLRLAMALWHQMAARSLAVRTLVQCIKTQLPASSCLHRALPALQLPRALLCQAAQLRMLSIKTLAALLQHLLSVQPLRKASAHPPAQLLMLSTKTAPALLQHPLLAPLLPRVLARRLRSSLTRSTRMPHQQVL